MTTSSHEPPKLELSYPPEMPSSGYLLTLLTVVAMFMHLLTPESFACFHIHGIIEIEEFCVWLCHSTLSFSYENVLSHQEIETKITATFHHSWCWWGNGALDVSHTSGEGQTGKSLWEAEGQFIGSLLLTSKQFIGFLDIVFCEVLVLRYKKNTKIGKQSRKKDISKDKS